MSSSDAQKSPVHQATEDSTTEPTGPAAPRGADAPADSGRRRTRDGGMGEEALASEAARFALPDSGETTFISRQS